MMKWLLPFTLIFLMSGCIATTEYVDAKCNQTEAKCSKYTHLVTAQAEEVREQVVAPDSDSAKGAQAVAKWHYKKHAEITVPPDPHASMGWGGILTVVAGILGAMGLGGGAVGVKLRSLGSKLSAKDEEYRALASEKDSHVNSVKTLKEKVSQLEEDMEEKLIEVEEAVALRNKHERAIEHMKKHLKEHHPDVWEDAKSILNGRA